jgi:hypothetical protein
MHCLVTALCFEIKDQQQVTHGHCGGHISGQFKSLFAAVDPRIFNGLGIDCFELLRGLPPGGLGCIIFVRLARIRQDLSDSRKFRSFVFERANLRAVQADQS